MTTRRSFLRQSSIISLASTTPLFLQRLAACADDKHATSERILVVIQLDGGNDGLNTIVPYRDPAYAQHRRRLRLPDDRLRKVTEEWGMHPEMFELAQLFEQHRLAVVHGVGYPNPNRSHFESMKIWHTASTVREKFELGNGWLGTSLSHGSADRNNVHCFHIGDDSVPDALRGRRCHCASLASGEDLQLQRQPASPHQKSAASPLSEYVTHNVNQAYTTAAMMRSQTVRDSSARYPGSKLAKNLELVSQLIKSDSRARVYYTLQSGYDTHASQLDKHEELLGQLSRAMKAFMDDMRASGLQDRVLVICFSEFGRRVEENSSQGTDHGAAGPMLLAGSQLAASSFSQLPSLTDLDDGDLRHTIDFRAVYAAIVKEWLKLPPPESIADFSSPSLFKQPT